MGKTRRLDAAEPQTDNGNPANPNPATSRPLWQKTGVRVGTLGVIAVSVLAATVDCGADPMTDRTLENGWVGAVNVLDKAQTRRYLNDSHASTQQGVQECMAAKGFDYQLTELAQSETHGLEYDLIDDGINDKEFAQRWGFGETTSYRRAGDGPLRYGSTRVEPVTDAQVAYMTSAGYQAAIAGDRTGNNGCMAEQAGQFSEDIARATDREAIIGTVRHEFARSPEVTKHYARWSECMANRGHDYVSPLQAFLRFHDIAMGPQTGDLTEVVNDATREREKTTAVDTVSCGGSVRNFLPRRLKSAWAAQSTSLR